jgi:hypothetical protein
MVKRLTTILFLVAVIVNSLVAVPPHRDGEGGCGAECCEAARQDGPLATISGICCITECKQSTETTTTAGFLRDPKSQPLNKPARFSSSISDQDPYLQYTRFPFSPTRFLHGSSSRYLDFGSLLI